MAIKTAEMLMQGKKAYYKLKNCEKQLKSVI